VSAIVLQKVRNEEIHSLNIFPSLENYLKSEVSRIIQNYFVKNVEKFFHPFDQKIYDEGVEIRKKVLSFLEDECSKLVNSFKEDKEKFNYDYGWYEDVPTEKRHDITADELAFELCEIIRKIYYIFLEDKFPEKYRTVVAEEFLLREEIN